MFGFHRLRQIRRLALSSPLSHKRSFLQHPITPAAITSISLLRPQYQRAFSQSSISMTLEVQEQLEQLQLQDVVAVDGVVTAASAAIASAAGGNIVAESASGRAVNPRRIPMPIAVAPMVDVTTSVSASNSFLFCIFQLDYHKKSKTFNPTGAMHSFRTVLRIIHSRPRTTTKLLTIAPVSHISSPM